MGKSAKKNEEASIEEIVVEHVKALSLKLGPIEDIETVVVSDQREQLGAINSFLGNLKSFGDDITCSNLWATNAERLAANGDGATNLERDFNLIVEARVAQEANVYRTELKPLIDAYDNSALQKQQHTDELISLSISSFPAIEHQSSIHNDLDELDEGEIQDDDDISTVLKKLLKLCYRLIERERINKAEQLLEDASLMIERHDVKNADRVEAAITPLNYEQEQKYQKILIQTYYDQHEKLFYQLRQNYKIDNPILNSIFSQILEKRLQQNYLLPTKQALSQNDYTRFIDKRMGQFNARTKLHYANDLVSEVKKVINAEQYYETNRDEIDAQYVMEWIQSNNLLENYQAFTAGFEHDMTDKRLELIFISAALNNKIEDLDNENEELASISAAFQNKIVAMNADNVDIASLDQLESEKERDQLIGDSLSKLNINYYKFLKQCHEDEKAPLVQFLDAKITELLVQPLALDICQDIELAAQTFNQFNTQYLEIKEQRVKETDHAKTQVLSRQLTILEFLLKERFYQLFQRAERSYKKLSERPDFAIEKPAYIQADITEKMNEKIKFEFEIIESLASFQKYIDTPGTNVTKSNILEKHADGLRRLKKYLLTKYSSYLRQKNFKIKIYHHFEELEQQLSEAIKGAKRFIPKNLLILKDRTVEAIEQAIKQVEDKNQSLLQHLETIDTDFTRHCRELKIYIQGFLAPGAEEEGSEYTSEIIEDDEGDDGLSLEAYSSSNEGVPLLAEEPRDNKPDSFQKPILQYLLESKQRHINPILIKLQVQNLNLDVYQKVIFDEIDQVLLEKRQRGGRIKEKIIQGEIVEAIKPPTPEEFWQLLAKRIKKAISEVSKKDNLLEARYARCLQSMRKELEYYCSDWLEDKFTGPNLIETINEVMTAAGARCEENIEKFNRAENYDEVFFGNIIQDTKQRLHGIIKQHLQSDPTPPESFWVRHKKVIALTVVAFSTAFIFSLFTAGFMLGSWSLAGIFAGPATGVAAMFGLGWLARRIYKKIKSKKKMLEPIEKAARDLLYEDQDLEHENGMTIVEALLAFYNEDAGKELHVLAENILRNGTRALKALAVNEVSDEDDDALHYQTLAKRFMGIDDNDRVVSNALVIDDEDGFKLIEIDEEPGNLTKVINALDIYYSDEFTSNIEKPAAKATLMEQDALLEQIANGIILIKNKTEIYKNRAREFLDDIGSESDKSDINDLLYSSGQDVYSSPISLSQSRKKRFNSVSSDKDSENEDDDVMTNAVSKTKRDREGRANSI